MKLRLDEGGADVFSAALRDAISALVRQHVPEATAEGRLAGLALTFEWVDTGPTAGDHVVFVDCDPARAVARFGRAMSRGADRRSRGWPTPPTQPTQHYRRRTDPPPPSPKTSPW